MILWREGVGGGRLVEVEAYLHEEDPACHAHCGPTSRNAPLFGPPGTLYVFRSYGVHTCLNVVCHRPGLGSGILFRALEPLAEVVVLRHNRGDVREKLERARLCSGPGRLGQALGADLSWNGAPLGAGPGVVLIDDGTRPPVECTERIGISRASYLPLRFILPSSPSLSRPPRHGRQVGPTTTTGER